MSKRDTLDAAEIAEKGSKLFDRHIKPKLRDEVEGKFVAIDVASGNYEVDADDYSAVMRLRNRMPHSEIWLERAGERTAYKMRNRQ